MVMVLKYHTLPTSVTQLDAHSTGDQEVVGLIPAGLETFFLVSDHEILSKFILSLR